MSPAASEQEFAGTERFQVLGRLGQGGMGVVYKALDRERNAHIALKTLRTLSPDGIVRFKNEFRALQDLQHPNLVSLGELVSVDGQWFFTMELVDGVDFLTWVRPVMGYAAPPGDFALSPDAATLPPEGGAAAYEALAPTVMRPELDERRLREGLRQLASGLATLHAAQKVHRDIKPSNILVTQDGRVVLLDFGLATEVGGQAQSEVNIVGTADYMAPEQAASQPAGPSADWYSMGVVLYEALTGRLPFSGAPLEVLIAKQRRQPPPPATVARNVPADLAQLCVELLERDPAARPDGAAVLKRLGAVDAVEARAPASTPSAAPFVGRARELDQLSQAFVDSREGKAVTMLVQGESGVGKTALVRQLVERLRARARDVVVLSGRCYERESVPYKALDGVVDALARFMMRLDKAEASLLLPHRVSLLSQAFPVLERVEAVREAPGALAPDPNIQRQRIFAAMRELFIRLGERRPLALVIDDLQWADDDSLALLREILHPPESPSLLLVATVRTQKGEPAPLTNALPGDVRQLTVDRLPRDEALELATLLGERSDRHFSVEEARAIADEARGHPLFIDELVRHAGHELKTGRLHLEDALWARIRQLEAPQRQLLELVAMAGRPLSLTVAARAVAPRGEDPDAAEVARHAALLRGGNLVRSFGVGDELLEPFHDRVRAAVLGHLDGDRLKQLHALLAFALEQQGGDPEALALHLRGAGELPRAAEFAEQAAVEATHAVAFDRAARLYRLALQLAPEVPQTLRRQIGLAEALSNLGRCGDAALCYLTAAKLAPAADSIELQRRASLELLTSGHIDEGLVGLRTVLSTFDMKLAETPRRALGSLLMRRARLRLRGIHFHERQESQIPVEDLRRIDLCWSVAIGLAMVDTVRSSDFQTEHLLLALEAGEPYRIARALALEGAFAATDGRRDERAERLLAAGRELAARVGEPHAVGLGQLATGVVHFLQGRWSQAHEHCTRALDTFREQCTHVTWETNTAQQFSLLALVRMGHLAELHRVMPLLRRSARERGDLYASLMLRSGLLSLYTLVSDEPERTREEIDEAHAKWSQQGFQLQHYWELYSKVMVDLYVGDGRTGLDRLTARWPVMERSLLLRTENLRYEARLIRAAARLSTATRLMPTDPERAELIDLADREARKLGTHKRPWIAAQSQLVSAGAAAARGQTARAMALLDQAVVALEAAEMFLMANVARRRRGQLEGGASGAALVEAAEAWMHEQKIKSPRRVSALFAPGFPD